VQEEEINYGPIDLKTHQYAGNPGITAYSVFERGLGETIDYRGSQTTLKSRVNFKILDEENGLER